MDGLTERWILQYKDRRMDSWPDWIDGYSVDFGWISETMEERSGFEDKIKLIVCFIVLPASALCCICPFYPNEKRCPRWAFPPRETWLSWTRNASKSNIIAHKQTHTKADKQLLGKPVLFSIYCAYCRQVFEFQILQPTPKIILHTSKRNCEVSQTNTCTFVSEIVPLARIESISWTHTLDMYVLRSRLQRQSMPISDRGYWVHCMFNIQSHGFPSYAAGAQQRYSLGIGGTYGGTSMYTTDKLQSYASYWFK